MTAGRPQKAEPGALYAFAHQFYWDFRSIVEGGTRKLWDKDLYEKLAERIDRKELRPTSEQKANIAEVAKREILSGRLKRANKSSFIRSADHSQVMASRAWLNRLAAEKATKELRIPGEPEAITELLQAKTPELAHFLRKRSSFLPFPICF